VNAAAGANNPRMADRQDACWAVKADAHCAAVASSPALALNNGRRRGAVVSKAGQGA
jgi:hypothetical protein